MPISRKSWRSRPARKLETHPPEWASQVGAAASLNSKGWALSYGRGLTRRNTWTNSGRSGTNDLESGSVITLTEVLTLPIRNGATTLELEYRDLLLHRRNFTLVSVNVAAAGRAAALRARYGIMTPDAIVVATALEMQCQVLLTNDLRLRRVAELRVLVLDDFLV